MNVSNNALKYKKYLIQRRFLMQKMPKTAKIGAFVLFLEKKCPKILSVSKMAVILPRFSTEISSSGLGRRPLTAETRVRVPVSLPNEAFSHPWLGALSL